MRNVKLVSWGFRMEEGIEKYWIWIEGAMFLFFFRFFEWSQLLKNTVLENVIVKCENTIILIEQTHTFIWIFEV